ncbi:hypothetical protein LDENG_00081330 [Lucifuga dentata]|nr:hypothetical protein LDENG_00081330 [Lucifuga dentata]
MEWSDAQTYCREKYTDLATMDDMEDMNKVIAAVGSVRNVWIGLHDKDWNWKWSLTGDSFNEESQFSSWASEQPNYYDGRQCCVTKTDNKWDDKACDSTFPFVCYNGTNDPARTFVYVSEAKNWTDAQSYCREHYIDLASTRNKSENQQVQNVAPRYKDFWIGLFRNPWESWSDGSNSSFRYWQNKKPDNYGGNQHCVSSEINSVKHGMWEDKNCKTKMSFICYKIIEKKQFFIIKLRSVGTTTDMNDPAVTEGTLKQIEKKMKENRLTENIKIQWITRPNRNIFYKEETEDLVKRELC